MKEEIRAYYNNNNNDPDACTRTLAYMNTNTIVFTIVEKKYL